MEKCNNCDRQKPPILTEQKVKPLLSNNFNIILERKLPLYSIIENQSKIDNIKKTIIEARKLYSRGILQLNEIDTSIVTSNLGNKGNYKDEKVDLDLPVKNNENPVDTITFDVPLFIRMLEYAREDAKNDMDLHNVTEKTIALSKKREVLTMADYDEIVGKIKESFTMYHRNPSSKKVNKLKFNIYESLNREYLRKVIKEVLSKSPTAILKESIYVKNLKGSTPEGYGFTFSATVDGDEIYDAEIDQYDEENEEGIINQKEIIDYFYDEYINSDDFKTKVYDEAERESSWEDFDDPNTEFGY